MGGMGALRHAGGSQPAGLPWICALKTTSAGLGLPAGHVLSTCRKPAHAQPDSVRRRFPKHVLAQVAWNVMARVGALYTRQRRFTGARLDASIAAWGQPCLMARR